MFFALSGVLLCFHRLVQYNVFGNIVYRHGWNSERERERDRVRQRQTEREREREQADNLGSADPIRCNLQTSQILSRLNVGSCETLNVEDSFIPPILSNHPEQVFG